MKGQSMVRFFSHVILLLHVLVSVSVAQQDSAAYRAAAGLTNPEEKLRALEDFVARHPESKLLARAYDGLFELYADRGREADAVRAALGSLATLQPDARMSPYNRFAYALAERGMALDSALAWIDRSIEIALQTKSRNLFAYQDTKAYVLYKLGRTQEAEELQRIAIKGHEDDPEFLAHLALYERANKKPDDALRTLVKALYYGAEPDVRDDFLRWLDETEPAQRTERKNSIVMTTLRSLTDTLTRERLIAARSRCAIVMADLGVELGTAQQWAEAAVKSLDRHSSLNDVIAFKQSLALVLSAQGNHGEALTHLRSIEELVDPYDARFWLTLGRMYEQAGDLLRTEGAYMRGLVARTEKRLRGALEAVYAKTHGSPAGLDAALDSVKQESAEFHVAKYRKPTTPAGKVILAELFTGAECGPCVSSDLAFDKLSEYYPRTALAIVEYHVHIPGPDPLTTDESWDRYTWYEGQGTPTVVIEGRESIIGGGPKTVTRNRFNVYRYAIEKFENEAPRASLALNAALRNDSVVVKLTVQVKEKNRVKQPALHIALVERSVDYTGANGIARHAFVVRRMFDGAQGMPLNVNTPREHMTKTVSLADVEATIKQYLDNPTAQRSWSYRRPFTGWRARPERLDRSNLALVAWVQDMSTKEVLQAVYQEL
jgi:tetratricopeptide (TPR) repeat protein